MESTESSHADEAAQKILVCDKCFEVLYGEGDLRIHNNKKHHQEKHLVSLKKFSSSKLVKRKHMKHEDPHDDKENCDARYSCELCPLSFLTARGLCTHTFKKHGVKSKLQPAKVKKCDVEATKIFVCDKCCDILYGEDDLLVHNERKHQDEPRLDNITSTASDTEKFQVNHIKLRKPCYPCDLCPMRFSTARGLSSHASQRHGLDLHLRAVKVKQCNVCDRTFEKYHKKYNANAPGYICEVCHFRYGIEEFEWLIGTHLTSTLYAGKLSTTSVRLFWKSMAEKNMKPTKESRSADLKVKVLM